MIEIPFPFIFGLHFRERLLKPKVDPKKPEAFSPGGAQPQEEVDKKISTDHPCEKDERILMK